MIAVIRPPIAIRATTIEPTITGVFRLEPPPEDDVACVCGETVYGGGVCCCIGDIAAGAWYAGADCG